MANRSRNIHVHVRVNEREREIIEQKMSRANISNMNTYMRKMAIDGYVVHLDMSDVRELLALLRNISNNVNQIARRVNQTHNLYEEDVGDIRHGVMGIWKSINVLLDKWEGV